MENIKISKLIQHHELLRSVPIGDNERDLKLGCHVTGVRYTSHERAVGEALNEALAQCKAGSRILVIHDSDQDGNVAALILKAYLEDLVDAEQIKMAEYMHGTKFVFNALKELHAFGEGDVAFILDQAFNKALYEELCDRFDKVFWVDHHPVTEESDVEIRLDHDTIFITNTYSTANLVWRMVSTAWWLTGHKRETIALERVAYLTHFHDTWQYVKGAGPVHERLSIDAKNLASWFDLETDSRKMLEMVFSTDLSMTESIDYLSKFCEAGQAATASRGMIHKRLVKECIGKVTWTLDDTVYHIGYAMHSDARSTLSQDILAEYDDLNTAMVVFYSARDGKMRISMRSRPDGPSVEDICKLFGGGGHRNASGFAVSPETLGLYLQDRTFQSKGTL